MRRMLPVMMLFMLFGLTACETMAPKPEVLPAGVQLNAKYYTQVTMQYEKGKYRTSNYRRGALLAVNTEVELLGFTRKSITVKLIKQNKELLIENVIKHTGEDPYQAFAKLFAKQPLNLRKFTSAERKKITQAKAAKGMSKDAVLVAIGYPPITRTPTLESDDWTYWSNRFNTFIVYFENGKVSRIKD
ncbi:MAG: hypothetical protein methR_P1624 [Methyloprofundus sp.]|nr:MAG: hypothetical protein methR_P1624 [Methyloprofundus sp.]